MFKTMEQHTVKIESISKITHDVLKIVTEKPVNYAFIPGQATEVCINKESCKEEKGPFTFTSLPNEDHLEFTIKTYPSHEGITSELLELKERDELILHNIFGAIAYKGEGVFIAGGAGVTPFISILRNLASKKQTGNNKLIFANKTEADIILKDEFSKMLGKNFINILSEESSNGYAHGQITEEFLKANIGSVTQFFYLCGPLPMVKSIEKQLLNLNVDPKHIIKEKL
jgi:ferredoxin-NADP reductase